ncbi:MAG: MarR family transcriptional regulator [Candidatus Aenigmarchaeota archaeon]|nr:MarR family transcriptional regulator [Candidatus Aenigmarchaeota archaeon]
MLISDTMDAVIRVLLNSDRLTLKDIARETETTKAACSKIINKLYSTGYISKRPIKVLNKIRLLKAWAYSKSIKELKSVEFIAAERAQYNSKKIATIADANQLEYAFTLFTAAEIVMPITSAVETHAYILKTDIKKWISLLKKNNIYQSQKGNIIFYPVKKNYFFGSKKIRSLKIISVPQLYTDLFSVGGRGEELAEEILKNLIYGEKNV